MRHRPGVSGHLRHAVVEVLEGEGKGDFQQIDIPADVVASGVAKGETVVLSRDGGAEGGGTLPVLDYERSAPIVVLAILFAVVVGAGGAAAWARLAARPGRSRSSSCCGS